MDSSNQCSSSAVAVAGYVPPTGALRGTRLARDPRRQKTTAAAAASSRNKNHRKGNGHTTSRATNGSMRHFASPSPHSSLSLWPAALVILSLGATMVPNNDNNPLLLLPKSTAEALSITTFNVLASVHRSVQGDRRESERRDWWAPRAEGLARFVADELASSDAVLLQEWWFRREFEEIFDHHTEGIFDRIAEQRPGPGSGTLREDGMAVLVNKRGKLQLLGSSKVQTGPQRIGQIVQCRERIGPNNGGGGGRPVLLGNAHLSFPGGPDPVTNERRQAYEVQLVARALTRAGRRLSANGSGDKNNCGHMQILAGDFNSNSRALASAALESPNHHFVNCMHAHAEQNLNSIGGPVSYGVTHHTHRGENVSVDQIFCRLMNDRGEVSKTSLRRLGGPAGTHVVDCRKRQLRINGTDILSDHMPVTAVLHWPEDHSGQRNNEDDRDRYYDWSTLGRWANMTLHPLQSPWDS